MAIRRRHFLVSAILPYIFILFLGVGLLAATVVSGRLAALATREVAVFGLERSLEVLSSALLYLVGVAGEPGGHRDLSRHLAACQTTPESPCGRMRS